MAKSTTFAGAPKPFGGKGHFVEPKRHALQAKGIRTGHLAGKAHPLDYTGKKMPIARTPKSFSFDEHLWAMERDEKGNYKLRLGNWTDAGWNWDGETGELAGFFARIESSQVRGEFLQKMKEGNISFASIKPALVKSAEKGDGIYELTGDNRKWEFEESDSYFERSNEWIKEEHPYLTDEDWTELDNNIDYGDYKGADFEEYKKTNYYKNAKKAWIEAVKKANSYEDLFQKVREEKDANMDDLFEFSDEEATRVVADGWEKFEKANHEKLETKRKWYDAQHSPAQTKLVEE